MFFFSLFFVVRTRSWTSSLPLSLSSIFTRAFPRPNLSLALVMLILARKRLKAFTTFGIILIAGGALNGLIRKSTRVVTGLFLFTLDIGLYICADWYISRDDKRYTEKKNKSERARRKKEDIAKIRGLVDMTLR
jgi:hypothetical protein